MKVVIAKSAQKSLRRAPQHIVQKLWVWVELVECNGLRHARELPGFHDEVLHGRLKGKRSIRLSRKWRAIYSESSGEIKLIVVEEVTPHEYKK